MFSPIPCYIFPVGIQVVAFGQNGPSRQSRRAKAEHTTCRPVVSSSYSTEGIMNIFLAFIPFLVAFIMIAFLQQSVQRTGIVTLVITCVVILLTPIFHLVPTFFFSALGSGVGLALSLFATLFPALLLYQLLSMTGATETIAQSIRRYCPQPELQVLLFVLGFSPFIEGVCGFGVGIVVTVPLFLALGLSRRQAALL